MGVWALGSGASQLSWRDVASQLQKKALGNYRSVRVQGSSGLWLGLWALGWGYRVPALGFRVWGFGSRV